MSPIEHWAIDDPPEQMDQTEVRAIRRCWPGDSIAYEVEVVTASHLLEAVDIGLRELVADAREQCQRNGIGDDKLPAWIGKMVLARVTGEGQ